jgi:hypothetical protein
MVIFLYDKFHAHLFEKKYFVCYLLENLYSIILNLIFLIITFILIVFFYSHLLFYSILSYPCFIKLTYSFLIIQSSSFSKFLYPKQTNILYILYHHLINIQSFYPLFFQLNTIYVNNVHNIVFLNHFNYYFFCIFHMLFLKLLKINSRLY